MPVMVLRPGHMAHPAMSAWKMGQPEAENT